MTETVTIAEKAPNWLPMRVKTPTKRDIYTTLNYYRDPGNGTPPTPVYVGGNTVTNDRPTAPTKVLVRDVTGEEWKYKIDNHGFEFAYHKSNMRGFDEDEIIEKSYYPECKELYKQVTGASQVHIIGHLVRRGPSHWHVLGKGNALKKGPLHRVHVDQSYDGAALVVRKHFPELIASLLPSPHDSYDHISEQQRWAIVNLWRPLNKIYKDPLAIASAHSIPEADLVEAKVIYTKQPPPLNMNKTWSLVPNGKHEWYYKNEMTRDEVLLIKCFDNGTQEDLARRTPHCAFVDEERSGDEWADRESIEVRAVLVWNN